MKNLFTSDSEKRLVTNSAGGDSIIQDRKNRYFAALASSITASGINPGARAPLIVLMEELTTLQAIGTEQITPNIQRTINAIQEKINTENYAKEDTQEWLDYTAMQQHATAFIWPDQEEVSIRQQETLYLTSMNNQG